MQRFLASISVATIFLVGFPATAAEVPPDVPEKIMARIVKLCHKFTDQDNIRCKAREVRRYQQSFTLTRVPFKDFEFRDGQDFGQGHLRARLRAERQQETRRNALERKTYRELQPVDNVNTQQRSYLNTLRMEQLKCQLESPGRPRALCFDRVGNWVRKQMREDRKTMQYPAQ